MVSVVMGTDMPLVGIVRFILHLLMCELADDRPPVRPSCRPQTSAVAAFSVMDDHHSADYV
jgi:hypothetical protein